MEITNIYLQTREQLIDRIFSKTTELGLQELQLDVFRFQFQYNPIYRSWCETLRMTPAQINYPNQIPYLPVSFFRKFRIQTGSGNEEKIFRSSGTSGQDSSQHFISDLSLYRTSAMKTFCDVFGSPQGITIIGLLPSYLERDDSSLVYMCDMLMKESRMPESGFYLDQFADLRFLLEKLAAENRKVWLIGVSFALLDFSACKPPVWSGLTVVETGGMKGRRKEMVREELHETIRQNWPLAQLYSEYGMTELLSQAYASSDGWFSSPPWMQIRIRDSHDPFHTLSEGQTGGIEVADLANLDSCSFISTEDLGKADHAGKFTVSGRFDHAVLRGCNLLLS